MKIHDKKIWLYHSLFVLGLFAVVLGTGVALLTNVNPDKAGFFQSFISRNANHAWYVVPILNALFVLCIAFRKLIGEPWVWKFIQKTLDVFQKELFHKNEPVFDHRITIFRRVSWASPFKTRRWKIWKKENCPFSGWLIPVARSHHVTQKNATVFLCPDDPKESEGIAGLAFVQKGTLVVDNLPDLSDNSTDEDIKKYSSETNIDPDFLIKRIADHKPNARSFYAFVIERKDEPWGVVVLDSRDPKGIKSPRGISRNIEILSKQLNFLLEKIQ